jgi:hypothetical protein
MKLSSSYHLLVVKALILIGLSQDFGRQFGKVVRKALENDKIAIEQYKSRRNR